MFNIFHQPPDERFEPSDILASSLATLNDLTVTVVFRIRDLPYRYLVAGIRDFKTIWRRNSGFTGLSENLDRDNGKGSLFIKEKGMWIAT